MVNRPVAGVLAAQLGATVRAGIDERADPAVVAPAENQRPERQRPDSEITGFGKLGLVPEQQPAVIVNRPLLSLEQLVRGVGEAVDAKHTGFRIVDNQRLAARF
jgi:hypothetical protein